MTSIFEPVNPPKQGPNSNQNYQPQEVARSKCQRVYLPLPLDPNDHRNQYKSYTFVLVLSDLRFLGGGEHAKKMEKCTANWVLFVKYFFTVAVQIQENVVDIHSLILGEVDEMSWDLHWHEQKYKLQVYRASYLCRLLNLQIGKYDVWLVPLQLPLHNLLEFVD